MVNEQVQPFVDSLLISNGQRVTTRVKSNLSLVMSNHLSLITSNDSLLVTSSDSSIVMSNDYTSS